MFRTRVGYAAGSTPNPTYRRIGNHAETVELDYDPSRITYAELLSVFWSAHDPTYPTYSSQYRSIIFYRDEEQKRAAVVSRERLQEALRLSILTEIRPYKAFYLAEAYHQKYWLQSSPLFRSELRAIYPDEADFVNSTAAARVNGFLGGYGRWEMLEREAGGYGLSRRLEEHLLAFARRRESAAFPSC